VRTLKICILFAACILALASCESKSYGIGASDTGGNKSLSDYICNDTTFNVTLNPGDTAAYSTCGISEIRISGGMFQVSTASGAFNFNAASIDCRGVSLIDFSIKNISTGKIKYTVQLVAIH